MEIVSSLHVLNVHIQYVHYTYTYSRTLHGWLPTCYSCWERLSQTKMSSESSVVKTAAFMFFCFVLFWKTSPKEKRKKKEGEPKKKILILDRCVTFVNETYWIPLCTTMLMISTKPTHCRKMSTSTLVYFVFRPITVHFRRLKASLLFLKCRLKSKYKI